MVDDMCNQFQNGIFNQFILKIDKTLLNRYSEAVKRLDIDVGASNNFSDYETDAISDPNNVIIKLPTTNARTREFNNPGSHTVKIRYNGIGAVSLIDICSVNFTISQRRASCNITVRPIKDQGVFLPKCDDATPSDIGDANSAWCIKVENIIPPASNSCVVGSPGAANESYKVTYPSEGGSPTEDNVFTSPLTYFKYIGKPIANEPGVFYQANVISANGTFMCGAQFNVATIGATPLPTQSPTPVPTDIPPVAPGMPTYTPPPPFPSLAPICERLPADFVGPCDTCRKAGKLWTAIGCIPTDLVEFVKDYVFVFGVGIGGGISFLYFLYGVFLVITSAGVAEKIAEGREIIISALSGLLLIIFSVFFLRVMGVDILRLPGFV
jgi:hypothetical protein